MQTIQLAPQLPAFSRKTAVSVPISLTMPLFFKACARTQFAEQVPLLQGLHLANK